MPEVESGMTLQGTTPPNKGLERAPLPRCQARNRAGGQCGQRARSGQRVCYLHGAGKKGGPPPGRPVKIYSLLGDAKLSELRERLAEYDHDLDNSDEELLAMRAALWYLFEQADKQQNNPVRQEELTDRVMNYSHRIIRAIKERAETNAKRAEARALEGALVVVTAVRNIVWELLDDEMLDLFEQRLRREVLAPRQLALPERG